MSAQSAPISVSTSGDNVIVAGVAGYAIRVIGYDLSFSGTVNAKWMSGTGGGAVALSGLIYGASGGANVVGNAGMNARGWFQTASGQALNLNLSAAIAVGGFLTYELIAQ